MAQDHSISDAHAAAYSGVQAAIPAISESALSRWDNEGGALAWSAISLPADIPELANVELVHLRIRVIALENLMIAMLARAVDEQIAMGDAMATHIAPHPGSAHHPLTEHAAQQMREMLARARHYRDTETP
ncbi:hypothetical protein J2X73_003648 [Novosphingobium sp. 1748]|uniref:hypothetical protein n=1 Tax=Novosphingobium sp. 1748 TaxID=2817760 RepID=UPI00285ED20C|nr:hypothetical protein [Novosphingobium sp. 1748]MDR6709259.1 hypothetical protein [Novosphingobium sp. 1748]